MDIMQIAKMLNLPNGMNSQQLATLWNEAQKMGAGVQTKEQALKLLASKGIDQTAIAKTREIINNPLAGMAASAAGINIDKVRADFNALFGGTVNKTSSADVLTKYKQGYKQL